MPSNALTELLKDVMINVITWEVWETRIPADGTEFCTMEKVEHKHQNPPVMGEGCRACHLMDEFTAVVAHSDRSTY